MSDLKDRVSILTAGNANVLAAKGDLITGDGQQTVVKRASTGVDGQVLTLDSSQPDGLSWAAAAPVGSITNVTGSDGVTVTTPSVGVRNATNDLVTGVQVAEINGNVTGDARIEVAIGGTGSFTVVNDQGNSELLLDGSGTVLLSKDASKFEIAPTGLITIDSGTANLHLDAGAALDLDAATVVTVDAPGNISVVSSGGDVSLQSGTNADINLTSVGTGDINVTGSHDEIHTVDRNFSLTAGGAGGITLSATLGDIAMEAPQNDIIMRAGATGGTGEIALQPGTTSATRTFRIWDGAGFGQKPFVDPGGTGEVIDAEARTAILAISNALHAWGWFAAGS